MAVPAEHVYGEWLGEDSLVSSRDYSDVHGRTRSVQDQQPRSIFRCGQGALLPPVGQRDDTLPAVAWGTPRLHVGTEESTRCGSSFGHAGQDHPHNMAEPLQGPWRHAAGRVDGCGSDDSSRAQRGP